MVEKGDIVSDCPKQSETVSKIMSSVMTRHTEDPWLEYIESIFVDFKNVSDMFCLYNEHLTPFFATGGTFNRIIL